MSTSKAISNGILRAVSIILGVILLLYFLYLVRSVLLYILIGAVISLVGRPLMLFLTNKLKMRSSLAVGVCLFVFLLFFAGTIGLFVPVLAEQYQNVSEIDISKLEQDVDRLIGEFTEYFKIEKLNVRDLVNQIDFIKYIDGKRIPEVLGSVFGGFGSFMIGLFSVIFIAFFTLKDSKLLEKSLLAFAKTEDENKFLNAFTKIKQLLSRYFVGLLFQVIILFVLYSILLLALGIDNAIAVALIGAFLNLIPYLGPVISIGIMTLFAITGNLDSSFSEVILPKIIWLSSGFIAIQLIDNFANQPIIFGNSVRSHPLEIFLAILVFGLLFGIGGLIAAVPLYTAIKVISKEFLSEYKIVQYLTKEI